MKRNAKHLKSNLHDRQQSNFPGAAESCWMALRESERRRQTPEPTLSDVIDMTRWPHCKEMTGPTCWA